MPVGRLPDPPLVIALGLIQVKIRRRTGPGFSWENHMKRVATCGPGCRSIIFTLDINYTISDISIYTIISSINTS